MALKINKSPVRIYASAKAVIPRFLSVNENRIQHIVNRVQRLSEVEAADIYNKVLTDYGARHRDITASFRKHFEKTAPVHHHTSAAFSQEKRLLTGALFTMEYAIKAAALFNPSIVAHPNQGNLLEGEKRFIISLRAVGEGHISSITFRTGVLNAGGDVKLDAEPPFYTTLEKVDGVGDGDANYELTAAVEIPLNEQVIFPNAKSESMGMEDVRFVHFQDGVEECYYGTYTAYDGRNIQTKLIETKNFRTYKISTLSGAAIQDKGMALFPEKVNGQYVMISRQGGEMINIMYSSNLYNWEKYEQLAAPAEPWEFVQLGNCGSPIKTPKGWLLLTHGVGPMRTYVISAMLLDLNEPSKIIGRLTTPLIKAEAEDREGYVPNVVYTCGFMQHGELLLIPYAVSDSSTAFASLPLEDLLNELKP